MPASVTGLTRDAQRYGSGLWVSTEANLALLDCSGVCMGTRVFCSESGYDWQLQPGSAGSGEIAVSGISGAHWEACPALTVAQADSISAISDSVPSGSLIAVNLISENMDLVGGAGNFYSLIDPCPFYLVRLVSPSGWITSVGGTRSVVGTFQSGSNSAADDYGTAAAFNSAFLTQAANTLATLNINTVTPVPVLDLTTNGFRIKIVTAMTGTVPVCTVRATAIGLLMAI